MLICRLNLLLCSAARMFFGTGTVTNAISCDLLKKDDEIFCGRGGRRGAVLDKDGEEDGCRVVLCCKVQPVCGCDGRKQ